MDALTACWTYIGYARYPSDGRAVSSINITVTVSYTVAFITNATGVTLSTCYEETSGLLALVGHKRMATWLSEAPTHMPDQLHAAASESATRPCVQPAGHSSAMRHAQVEFYTYIGASARFHRHFTISRAVVQVFDLVVLAIAVALTCRQTAALNFHTVAQFNYRLCQRSFRSSRDISCTALAEARCS